MKTDILQKLYKGCATQTAEQTISLAQELAAVIPENSTLALHGDLGVGKTTFVHGLAKSWDISQAITSPTYNIFTLYQGSRLLLHLDAYRLNSDADFEHLLIDDFLSPPYCFVIEWPEKIPGAIPQDAWHITLSIQADRQHYIQLEQQAIKHA